MKARTVLQRARDYVPPLLSAAVLFGLLAVLLVAGHRSALREAFPSAPHTLSEEARDVLLATARLSGRDPAGWLAAVLSQRGGPAGLVERSAYRILLSFKPEDGIASALFAAVSIRIEYTRYAGFGKAGEAWFGVPGDELSAGELALLCHAALQPRGVRREVESSIVRRNRLLGRLYACGVISRHALDRERARPLALAPDPRPIW